MRPKRKNIRVSDEIMQRVVVEQRPPKVDIRKWNVNISDYEKLLIKFGKPKKKKRKGKGKKKKNKSK